MAASAALTIPVTMNSPAQRYDVETLVGSTPGASEVAVDPVKSQVVLQYQFPGNIDTIMRKLRVRGLTAATTMHVSVPVKNLTGRVVDAREFVSHLNASPAVTGANFDGATVSATIVPMTASMRYVYEEIILAGLTAMDFPTVAGKQEFVL